MSRRRPSGDHLSGRDRRGGAGGRPLFVVQRHDASTLHFDLRLQAGDVLASWAVPKGPSLDPRDKRLARRTEDHPLDHLDFEGVIGKGRFGVGSVVVWDTGAYENLTQDDGARVDVADALERGHVKVRLHGERLTGACALTRTRMDAPTKRSRRRRPTRTALDPLR